MKFKLFTILLLLGGLLTIGLYFGKNFNPVFAAVTNEACEQEGRFCEPRVITSSQCVNGALVTTRGIRQCEHDGCYERSSEQQVGRVENHPDCRSGGSSGDSCSPARAPYPECRNGRVVRVHTYTNCTTLEELLNQSCSTSSGGGNNGAGSGGNNSGSSICESYDQCGDPRDPVRYPPTMLVRIDLYCNGEYAPPTNLRPGACAEDAQPIPAPSARSATQPGAGPDAQTSVCPYEQKSEESSCSNGQRCYNDLYRDSSTSCQWIPKSNPSHCDADPTCGGGASATCDQNECSRRYTGGYCSNGVCNPPSITNSCETECKKYGPGASCNSQGECVPPAFESSCSEKQCVHRYGPGSYCSPNGKTCISPSISGPRGNNRPVPGGIDCGGGCNKIRNICLAAYYTSHPAEAANSGAVQICQVKKDRLTQIGQNLCYFLETNTVSQAKAQCDLQWESCMSVCKN